MVSNVGNLGLEILSGGQKELIVKARKFQQALRGYD